MAALATCPDLESLERFALSRLDDAEYERVEEHLLHCEGCLGRIESVRAGDAVADAVLRQAGLPEAPDPPALRDLVDRVRRLSGATSAINGQASTVSGPTEVPAPSSPPLAQEPAGPGRLGDYRLLRLLGQGGMGSVYLAEDARLGRQVAVKTLRPELVASPQARERFLREARTAAALEHDHIVPIYHVGEDGGVPFLAMPLLQGESLEALLRREPRLATAEVLRIGREAAEGLAAAHAAGLVHRDIKPANLWVEAGPRRRIKVLDFGLARPVQKADDLTQTGVVVGTPAYMAPEQAEGLAVDARCDLFSLGCVLYRMGTGRLPFQGNTVASLLLAIATEQPPAPRQLNPEVPEALSDLIIKLLARNPENRLPSASAVVEALKVIEVPALPASATTLLEESTSGARRSSRILTRAQKVSAALALTALASAIALGAFVISFRDRDGTLVVTLTETDRSGTEPGLDLVVDGKLKVPVTSARAGPFQLLPGRHTLVVKRADKDLFTASFAVEPGKQVVIDVPLRPNPPPTESPFDQLLRTSIPEYELTIAAGRHKQAPAELVAVLGDSRFQPGTNAWCVAFDPTGNRIASGGVTGKVSMWDAHTGRQIFFAYAAALVSSVAFSPDGKLLACPGGSNTVRVWDTGTRSQVFSLEGHTGYVTGLAFSPDGHRLASSSCDRSVRVWDLKTARAVQVFRGHNEPVHSVAFSADGRRVASGSSDNANLHSPGTAGEVKVWDAETGNETLSLKQANGLGWSVAFSPDGKLLAAGSNDGKVQVWDAATGLEASVCTGHTGGVGALAFSPDGRRLASGSFDETMRLWDASTGKELFKTTGHFGPVCVAFSPDGKTIATGGKTGPIRLFDTKTGKPRPHPEGHFGPVLAVAVSPDGRTLASAGNDAAIRLWEVLGPAPVMRKVLAGHSRPVRSLAFSPDGRRLASASEDGTVRLWDPGDGRQLFTTDAHPGGAAAVAFYPDGKRLVSGGHDHQLCLWNVEGRQLFSMAQKGAVVALAISPDGRWLASATQGNGAITLRAADSLNEVAAFDIKNDLAESLAFSPDSKRLVSASDQGTPRLWRVPDGRLLFNLAGDKNYVLSVAFRPGGDTVASSNVFGELRLWDAGTGACRDRFEFEEPILNLAFSPDGRHLVLANGNGTLYVLRLEPARAQDPKK